MKRALDPIEWLSALVFLFAMVVVRIGDLRECRRYERTELRLRKRRILPPMWLRMGRKHPISRLRTSRVPFPQRHEGARKIGRALKPPAFSRTGSCDHG